eukprot:scaffold4772_cov153-Amphora_coffeaeformis.AAC.6
MPNDDKSSQLSSPSTTTSSSYLAHRNNLSFLVCSWYDECHRKVHGSERHDLPLNPELPLISEY